MAQAPRKLIPSSKKRAKFVTGHDFSCTATEQDKYRGTTSLLP